MEQPPADLSPPHHPGWSDERVEQVVGNLLRIGVVLSAFVVALGGLVYLMRHGKEPPPNRSVENLKPRHVGDMFSDAWTMHSGGIIELGLLLLIATPIARVVFSVIAFALQRDYVYVVITFIVLIVLLYSLFNGYLH